MHAALPSAAAPAVPGGPTCGAEVGGSSSEACAASGDSGQDPSVPAAQPPVPLPHLHPGLHPRPQEGLLAPHRPDPSGSGWRSQLEHIGPDICCAVTCSMLGVVCMQEAGCLQGLHERHRACMSNGGLVQKITPELILLENNHE